MAKARTLVGLDVHATKIVAAVLDAETGRAAVVSRSGGEPARRPGCARGCRGRSGRRMRPGRPGTGWRASSRGAAWSAWSRRRARSRARRAIGSRPTAATPSMLVRLLLAGKLHAVRVPGRRGGGAARSGPRARGGPGGSDALPAPALQAAAAPRDPLRRRARVDGPPPRVAGDDRAGLAGGAGDVARTRAARSTRSCTAATRSSARSSRCCPTRPGQPQVGRLRCLRGIDTLTAVGLCAEIGDFERFARAEQLMSYLGLVPCENTTGQQRRLGSITKTGSGHARRLLVEAAWHYRAATRDRQGAHRAPRRPTRRSGRDRLERPAAPAPHLEPARGARQAPHDHRRRRRPRTRRLLLGDHPESNNHRPANNHIPSAGSVAARQRAGNPRRNYEQPAPTGAGHARS